MDDPNDRAHARAPRLEDLVRICRSLNAAGARYLLIGGFAVIAHGGLRTTKDIDFLVDEEAARDAERIEIEIPVVSKRKLIRTKDTIGPPDAADRRFLEERIAAEGDENFS